MRRTDRWYFHVGQRLRAGVLLAIVPTLFLGAMSAAAGTLEDIRKRGTLTCGVSEGLIGFSSKAADGTWTGFDVDYCRAVAAAVLGDATKVAFVPLSASARFDALAEKKIDVLSRNTTWTMERDVVRGFEFVGVSYYDGQGFMTRRSNGLSSALQLAQASICVIDGTTARPNAEQYFAANKISVTFKTFTDRTSLTEAYEAEHCDAYSADRSGLASDRLRLTKPDDHMLLPEVISKEPLGPVMRQDDLQWVEVGRWVLNLLITGEEVGWTRAMASKGPLEPALTVPDAVHQKLGLAPGWPLAVIKAVGNYGEIFERNVGAESPLDLPRGVNALWSRGGILYAPPMQ